MTEQQPEKGAPETGAPETGVLPDQADMSVEQLARAVLDRQIIRPRIASVRRLAEALLAKKARKAKKKARKADRKARKLAKIPGQKGLGQKGLGQKGLGQKDLGQKGR